MWFMSITYDFPQLKKSAWYKRTMDFFKVEDYEKAMVVVDSVIKDPTSMTNNASKALVYHLKGYIHTCKVIVMKRLSITIMP